MLLRSILTLCLLIPSVVGGATYYVSVTNGLDGNSGTLLAPWKTIAKATATMVAGDSAVLKAGFYNEFVTNTASGTAGNPITFTGERSGSGGWLTIIDPSTTVSNGWVAATEFGGGCYKQTGVAFTTQELDVDNKRVPFVYALSNISSSISQAYTASGISNGYQFLSLPSAYVVTNAGSTAPNTWWDSVGALWCSTGSVTYLRFRDGSSPNGRNITCAPNHVASQTDIADPAIKCYQDYITWSNVLVRGAAAQIAVRGKGNTIVSNYLQNGFVRVQVALAAGTANVIKNNEMTANYYGSTDIGAWQTELSYPSNNFVNRENIYLVSKFIMSTDQSTFDYGVWLLDGCSSNVVTGNHIFGGIGTGIDVFGVLASYPPITNTIISANSFTHHASLAIILSEGETLSQVYSNRISDCNLSFRLNHVDGPDTNRSGFIYRNTSYQPTGAGQHFYVHYSSPSGQVYFPTYWIYQNSFSGGQACMGISSYAESNAGLTNFHFLNNIMSATEYIDGGNSDLGFWTNANMIQQFDYNEVTIPFPTFPSSSNPAWFGAHNIKHGAPEWSNVQGMDFALVDGSVAIDSGLDIPATYPTLPQTGQTRVGTGWDMGAYEFTSQIKRIMRVTNLHVNRASQ